MNIEIFMAAPEYIIFKCMIVIVCTCLWECVHVLKKLAGKMLFMRREDTGVM